MPVTMAQIDAMRGMATAKRIAYQERRAEERKYQRDLWKADLVDDAEEIITSAGLYVQAHRDRKKAKKALREADDAVEVLLREWRAQGEKEV